MSASLQVGSVVPERMAAIEARLGIGRITPRPSTDFDAVLSASSDESAPASPSTGLSWSAGMRVGAGDRALHRAPLLTPLPTSVLTSRASADPATPAGAGPRSAAGEAVIDAARSHLGVPYLWGGTDPAKGFDCSGLIQDAYRQIGVELPKWSRHQATMGVEVASLAEALPGDILTFGQPVTHVALYVGDGRMLHAPKRGEVVKIEDIDRTIGSIRRIVTPSAAVDPSAVKPGAVKPGAVDASAGPIPSSGPEPAGPVTTSVAPPLARGDHRPGQAEQRYRALFESAGQRWGVDPDLLAAVAQVESGFDAAATSPAGARGLMQFMPATAAEMGVDPWDPASAVDGAARYLRTSLDQFPDVTHAIASYNAGRGAVRRYGGIPPYRETQNYVDKVLEAWRARS